MIRSLLIVVDVKLDFLWDADVQLPNYATEARVRDFWATFMHSVRPM